MGLTLELPANVTTDEDRLRCALRLQQMICEKRAVACELAPDKAGSPTWKDFQNRLAVPSATICQLRRKQFPNRLKDGEGADGPYRALKAEARADKRWDSELERHPLLIARAAAPVDIDPYEDFDPPNYTEVDPVAYIAVADTAIVVTLLPTNVDAYVYRDFGAGHFAGDYTHLVETELKAMPGVGNRSGGFYATANEIDAFTQNTDVAVAYWYTNRYMYIAQVENGAFQDYDGSAAALAFDTWYFVTYNRTGAVVTCTICTVSHAGGVTDVLVIDDTGAVARQYAFGVISRNAASAWATSYNVRNLDLQEGIVILRRRIEGY